MMRIHYCLPGDRLDSAGEANIAGPGTYEKDGYICSSLAGIVVKTKEDKHAIVTVETNKGQDTVPTPGDIVTAEVVILTQRFVRCNIKCIRNTPLEKTLRGIIKIEDIRATEKDKIQVHECFRPGDIILARVLPVKELQSYQLTTAEDELGVVIAQSEAGETMVPISWKEMQCTKTLLKERRKVAKIIPE